MRKYFLSALAFLLLLALPAVGIYEITYPYTGEEISESEKRHLAAKPELTVDTLLSGEFESGAESFLLDHFPGREYAIQLSRSMLDAVSLASWEEYAAVIEGNTNDMEAATEEEAEEAELIVPTPIPTPVKTSTPAPTESPAPATTPEALPREDIAALSEPVATAQITPTIEPTATPRATKPPFDAQSFPELVSVSLKFDGKSSQPNRYARSTVKNQSQIFSSLASLLPEDGQLLFTLVPNSTAVTQLLAKKNPEGMHSDIETLVWACTSDKVETVSTADLLSDRILAGEYVFFSTDMHWTPKGAHYAVEAMAQIAGRHVPAYEAFSLTQEYPFLGTLYRDTQKKQMLEHPDTLDIAVPPGETTVYRYNSKTEYEQIPLIAENAPASDRYCVYLGGSAGPWTVIENTAAQEGTCLVICDSYGLCTLPMFAGTYSRVCYMDPRYYSVYKMGKLSELIPEYSVRDIYIITGTLHAFDKDFFPSLAKFF